MTRAKAMSVVNPAFLNAVHISWRQIAQASRALYVHERIIAERNSGRAVLLFSTELDEVTALADRIAVMYRGEFIAIVAADTSREELGLLMAGIRR